MLLIGEYAGMKEGAIAGDRKGKEGGMAKVYAGDALISPHLSAPGVPWESPRRPGISTLAQQPAQPLPNGLNLRSFTSPVRA